MKAKPEKSDLAAQTRRLREQVCELLGLDVRRLSSADELLVSRAGFLKLQLSDYEAELLKGGRIDSGAYTETSKELEAIFRSRLTPDGRPDTSGVDALRARLNHIIDTKIDEGIRIGLQMIGAENEKLRAENALLKGTPPEAQLASEQINNPTEPAEGPAHFSSGRPRLVAKREVSSLQPLAMPPGPDADKSPWRNSPSTRPLNTSDVNTARAKTYVLPTAGAVSPTPISGPNVTCYAPDAAPLPTSVLEKL
jgi:hypothetical protein